MPVRIDGGCGSAHYQGAQAASIVGAAARILSVNRLMI